MEEIGVCGAGVMGGGIAEAFARSGFDVRLFDGIEGAAEKAMAAIEKRLERDVEQTRLNAEEASAVMRRIRAVPALVDFAGVKVVVEAVSESIAIKQQVFRELDTACPPPTLLLTNTSTLSPTELGRVLRDPGRSAGMHFFNPAQRMKLVEVMVGLETRPETLELIKDLAARIGKTAVVLAESPGGIVSRLQLIVRNEAVRMVAEGVATAEDIDTAMKLGSGWPLGPIELIDLVGVDIHVNNCNSLSTEMGSERYRPHPFLNKLVRAGRLGRKSGHGFYKYD